MKRKGLLIAIEGTDCSGKETQTKKLVEKLRNNGETVFQSTFPQYDTPTGRIVGGPLLGKSYICEGWFPETSPKVDSLVSALYYAADRRYHKEDIEQHLNNGEIVILDRYTESNMAHQGSKIKESKERLKLFQKLSTLEYDILEIPKPDIILFLYMPYEYGEFLRQNRATKEALDQHESNAEHLKNAERTYLELAQLHSYITINCIKDNNIRSIDDINEELFQIVTEIINKNKESLNSQELSLKKND